MSLPRFYSVVQLAATALGQSGARLIGLTPPAGMASDNLQEFADEIASATGAGAATTAIRGTVKVTDDAAGDPVALEAGEKGAAGGLATLSGAGKHTVAEIPFGTAADTVAEGAHDHDAAYSLLGHDHAGVYAEEGHLHDAGDIDSGTVPIARLGTGTKNSSTVLHGDNVFRVPAGGGGGTVGIGSVAGVSPAEPGGDIALTAATGSHVTVSPSDTEDTVELGTSAALNAHLANTGTAHPAANISVADLAGAYAGGDVEAILQEIAQRLWQSGDLRTTARSAAAAGWLLCDGSTYPRATYPALYAALGGASSPWGQGDGSTTFHVPDLRGRTLVGAGSSAGPGLTARALGAKFGAETHLLTAAQSGLPAHTHPLSELGEATNTAGGGNQSRMTPGTGSSEATAENAAAPAAQAHNNVQPSAAVTMEIKI